MSYFKELETDLMGRCTTACPSAVVRRYGGEFFSDDAIVELKEEVRGRSATLLVKMQAAVMERDDSTFYMESESVKFEIGLVIMNSRRAEDGMDECFDILDALRKGIRNSVVGTLTDGVVPKVFLTAIEMAHTEPGFMVYRIDVVYTLKRNLEV